MRPDGSIASKTKRRLVGPAAARRTEKICTF
jgi:hypothetical protein